MSMMVSFVLSFFPRDVLDEILNLIESVSEDFPSYSLEYWGPKFRILGGQGGPNSQQAHDVLTTLMRRIDVISTSCAH